MTYSQKDRLDRIQHTLVVFMCVFQICSLILDAHNALIWIPLALFPSIIWCALGLTKTLGWFWGDVLQYDLWMFYVGLCSSSLFIAFVYRYMVVADRLT